MAAALQVLVGSSVEGLSVARAVQEQLQYEAEVSLWTDQVMRPSRTTMDSLSDQLAHSDFAILVVTPDDLTTVRGRNLVTARDNVILEIGLCVGSLGRRRTFLIAPRDVDDLHLPTDLLGYEPARYSHSHSKTNAAASVGPAVNQIRREILDADAESVRVTNWGMFSQLSSECGSRLASAQEVELCFIHSRRWRENHKSALLKAIGRGVTFAVYLPDPLSPVFTSLARHFDDAPFIPGLVADGYTFWRDLSRANPGQVNVYAFPSYPVYSYYRVDNWALVAFYQNSVRRTDVPAWTMPTNGSFWSFIEGDMKHLGLQPLDADELDSRSLPVTLSW